MMELTLTQIFQRAVLNTCLGMGTVFLVLIFISLLISLFRYIPQIQEKIGRKSAKPESNHSEETARLKFRAKTTDTSEAEEEYVDDRELVAVITAAIAAYQGTSSDALIVRSIKRAKKQNW